MDFMANLMEKDVAKRLTAKEALQHPWLQNDDVDNETAESPKNATQVCLFTLPLGHACLLLTHFKRTILWT